MRLTRYADARAFLAAAEDHLLANEARHCVSLGVASVLAAEPDAFPDAYLATVEDAGRVVLAAVRTPPQFVLVSEAADLAAVGPLVDDLLGLDPAIDGVDGPPDAARRFAEEWALRTGGTAHRAIAERAFELTRVVPPARPAAGHPRLAEPRDRGVVAAWIRAFNEEALPGTAMPDDLLPVADRWIGRMRTRTVRLWEDGGRVVSMVASAWPTRHGIRIAPVYTPPADRGRGYATSLTAAVAQAELDDGRERVFLFTDLANPTSNAIYRSIGFEPRGDVDRWAIEGARGA